MRNAIFGLLRSTIESIKEHDLATCNSGHLRNATAHRPAADY
jgi:hypothetical protein